MPQIFDNIDHPLLPVLKDTLAVSYRADFCVGYFNLRGWRQIDARVEQWTGGDGYQCRLLVGMHRRPQDELKDIFSFREDGSDRIDNKRAVQLKKQLADEFRRQLTLGAPTDADEAGLRRLAQQIKDGKLVVKLFLRHPLHAKLYLLFRSDRFTPIIGYMGSSNLTFSGLSGQGELNIDVLEQDAASKLVEWFNDRWDDKWCLDISQELVEIIEESWASEKLLPPYYIYLKMAYHLSREARAGLTEFTIPRQFRDQLFEFQTAAVKIAARHLNQRGGVLIGDVVGLGKTIMATAVAKIFEEDLGLTTLIICPKNLVKMWEDYAFEYDLRAKVMSITRVINRLAYRSIASNTNERTLIATVIPPYFTGNSLNVSESLDPIHQLVCVSLMDSFVLDWLLRQKVTTNINMFYIYQLPIPRLTVSDPVFVPIVERAAKLICTTPEFDDLAAEVGLGSHKNGVTNPAQRAQLRAELDGMIAHVYGLTEEEFTHILSTFPLVDEAVKAATLAEYRKLVPDLEVIGLVAGDKAAAGRLS